MNIGSITTAQTYQAISRQPSAEGREVGPENDGDSDDVKQSNSASSSGNTTADRGTKLNLVA